MRRMILSENSSDEKIFLFFSLLDNSIPDLVRLSGRWCEDELKEQQVDQEANLFRFTALTYYKASSHHTTLPTNSPKRRGKEPPSLDPAELFLRPVWLTPFHEEPDTLLWKQ